MDLVYCLFPFMTIKAFTVFEGIQLMMAFSFCVRFFFSLMCLIVVGCCLYLSVINNGFGDTNGIALP